MAVVWVAKPVGDCERGVVGRRERELKQDGRRGMDSFLKC